MTDAEYMKAALALAEKGAGFVSPNPLVGAVIVKDGEIIGQGFHEKYGAPHAERNALGNCLASPKGAALYVTLEPCCHYGKTPPCTDAIIESGISRVFAGVKDPNPLVSGKGIEILRRHGVEVTEGLLEKECAKLNEVFFYYSRAKRPFVVMKYAMTMDGKTASFSGDSKWITGEKARERVHRDRQRYSAIMIGVGTVLADDPLLTCRAENGRNPIRVICDTGLRTPLDSKIVKTADTVPTIIATACRDEDKLKAYTGSGCGVIAVSQKHGHIDLNELMIKLGERDIDSVLLEGGSALNWSALESGIVNKVQAYIAPKLLGGSGAKTPIAGAGIEYLNNAVSLINSEITVLGEDILIESEVVI